LWRPKDAENKDDKKQLVKLAKLDIPRAPPLLHQTCMERKTANAGRLAELHPKFAARVEKLLAHLESEGYPLLITQGLRTWEAQDKLYAQGRTAPGKIVTKARGGYSHHNFGLAVDLCPSFNAEDTEVRRGEDIGQGSSPDLPQRSSAPSALKTTELDWNVSHPAWQKLLAAAPAFGLAEGARWRTFPDTPHFYPAEIPATTAKLRAIYAAGGMAAVWKWFEELAAGKTASQAGPAGVDAGATSEAVRTQTKKKAPNGQA
jgi:peptidoglycan L-alanyl-D-glutamate endopeptidase CwlK